MSNAGATVAVRQGGSGTTSAAAPAAACDEEPARPTVDQAHEIMQAHISCPTGTCRHRQAALTVLVDARQYVLL